MNQNKYTPKRKKLKEHLPCPSQQMKLSMGVLHYKGSAWTLVVLGLIVLGALFMVTNWATPLELLAILSQ